MQAEAERQHAGDPAAEAACAGLAGFEEGVVVTSRRPLSVGQRMK